PLVGVGVGAFDIANSTQYHVGGFVNAHNAYIQIGAELGVSGLIVFIILIRAAFRAGIRARRRLALQLLARPDTELSLQYELLGAALTSLVGYLTAAFFLSLAYDAMTMFVLMVPVALGFAASPTSAVPSARKTPRTRSLRPRGRSGLRTPAY